MKSSINSKICLLIIGAAAVVFGAKIDLESYTQGSDSVPIGMVQFRSKNNTVLVQNEPWKIIADDLEFSGRFQVTRSKTVDTALFNSKGIGLYIDGEYTVHGEAVTLECFLYDAARTELLSTVKYQSDKKHLRAMSHRYADQLVELLLGQKGIAQSKIVYVHSDGRAKNIYIMDYDGQNSAAITSNNSINIFPVFVDSSVVLWTSYLRGKPDIYRGNIATGKADIFLYGRFVTASPSVSRIEDKVAYATSKDGNMEIYTCNLDKSGVKRLTNSRSIETSPSWSPNGYQIAFTSDRSGSPQIYVMDADGANVKRLTSNGNYQDSPSWSPAGDKIAYTSMQNGRFAIWTIAPDGTGATQVVSMAGNNEYPNWSPDGKHIVFCNNEGIRSYIYTVGADGTQLRRITSDGNSKMADWSK